MLETHADSPEAVSLGDYGCIDFQGEDAATFLQGQLSSDVAALAPGEGQLSTYNDPRGRVIALLRLFRTDGGFTGALPLALADAVARRLRMFVLRARVSISCPSRWRLTGVCGEDPPAGGCPALRLPSAEPMWNALVGDGPTPDAAESGDWTFRETVSGIPEVYPDTSGRFVAQMLRLDRMGAVSFTKGCFVGQEVVARAHHLGRVKRHLRLYRCLAGGLAPGDPVTLDGANAGEVARVADATDHKVLLAVVKDGADGPLRVGDAALEPLPSPPAFEWVQP